MQNAIIFKILLTNYAPYSMICRKVRENSRAIKTWEKQFMFENFKAFLIEELGRIDPDAITMEASLSGDLGINSLELADMVYNCETKYDVTIDDDSLKNFKTVGDVVRFLESTAK